MGEAIITRRGGNILKIAGQTEEIVKFGETINKYDPVCVKYGLYEFGVTKLSDPSTLPTNDGYGVAFDPTGTYLAVSHYSSPYITIYKRNGDTFTKLSDPSTLPASIGNGVAFDPTGTYLAVAHSSSPYITIYKRNGDTFTKLSDPSTLPTGHGFGVAFDSTGTYLAVAHDTSPYITIYLASVCLKTNLMSDVSIAARAGYAKESGIAGEYKKIVVIFR